MNKIFLGYQRSDGKVGTRNYYLIVPLGGCISETARQIAQCMKNSGTFSYYSNINGIVCIKHNEGCGCGSELQTDMFLRTLKGYITHPNVGGVLIVNLGCEQTDYKIVQKYLNNNHKKPVDFLTFENTCVTIKKAIEIIDERLKEINQISRIPCQLDKFIVGTQCGASDFVSGITANPVIGNTVDKIIYKGGSAIMSEIPEMLEISKDIAHRFRNQIIRSKFDFIIRWYKDNAKKFGVNLDDNLVSKNIEGGLENISMKNQSTILKGGSTTIEDVLEYAGPVKKQGLNIMQGPGNDLESTTGIVASGANIILFSTGWGTPTGNAICPVIKLSSNNTTYKKMRCNIDFNAGRLLDENISIDELGDEFLDLVLKVASGKETKSEINEQRQFQVWSSGKLTI